MAVLIKAATPIWKLIAISVSILGGMLLAGGLVLAFFGGTANTSIEFFGNTFSSTSVGTAIAFLGATMIVVVLRRILGSIDKITRDGGSESLGDQVSNRRK